MAMKRKVLVRQDPNKSVDPEVLADAVVATAKAAQQLFKSGLTGHALALLVNDLIPAAQRPGVKQVLVVLAAAARLDEFVAAPPPPCICEAVIARSTDPMWQRSARTAFDLGAHLTDCPRAKKTKGRS